MRTDAQLRFAETEYDIRSDGDGNTLVGHAAVFNSETVIAGFFREQIAPRSFRKSIKENDIRALFNHDTNFVLGRNRAGTLRLSEDDRGLAYEIDLPDTQAARDLWTSIDRGDISQSSFAFDVVKELREEPNEDAGETMPLYTIKEARLYEVSPVTFPAYEDTDVAARAMLRCSQLSGRSIDEIKEAIEAGELARIWTPRGATTPEPPAEPAVTDDHSDDTQKPERTHITVPFYL